MIPITTAERDAYRVWQLASDKAERAYVTGDDPAEVKALAVLSDEAWAAYILCWLAGGRRNNAR